jgi:phosphocarrier protein FPr
MRIGKDVVQVAGRFQATITAQNLTRPSPVVDARSILQLMQLQARQGHRIQVAATGPDAHDAVDALRLLLESAPNAPAAPAAINSPEPSP